jgi:hypothetical protein
VRLNIDSIDAIVRLDFHADRLVQLSLEFDMADWEPFKAIFIKRTARLTITKKLTSTKGFCSENSIG